MKNRTFGASKFKTFRFGDYTMSVLSVPLTPTLEEAIDNLLKWGVASNRADATRKAILRLEEEVAIQLVLESEQAVEEGKLIKGSLKDFIKPSAT